MSCSFSGARTRARLPDFALGLLTMLLATRALALSDEIQVYDGTIASPGTFNVTLHSNYVAQAGGTTERADAVPADRSLTGGTEWAYGAARWLELGIYTPIYTRSADDRWYYDGAEVRALFVSPDAQRRRIAYGLDVAWAFNSAHWDDRRLSLELRPLLTWHNAGWSVTLNPILESALNGWSGWRFEPATRVAYSVDAIWSLALEEYADDTGTIVHAAPLREQNHRLFAVVDARLGAWNIEPGLGRGLTTGSDGWTIKLILSRDLN